MFVCSRCGSSYNARHIGVEHCPRCRLRDRVEAPLAFKAFDLAGLKLPGPAPGQIEVSGTGTSTNTSAATPSEVT
jgi:hypothetical protein